MTCCAYYMFTVRSSCAVGLLLACLVFAIPLLLSNKLLLLLLLVYRATTSERSSFDS
jgi:hypothetical protein